MITQSETIGKVSEALSKAQVKFETIIKDAQAHRHKFAPLPVCIKSTRKALSDNGIAVTQTMNSLDDGRFILETTLGHISGEFFKSNVDLTGFLTSIKGPNPLHTWGSIITYTRRYAYLSIIGAASEDEDNDAMDVQLNKTENISKPAYEPITTQLINLIKASGCDINDFTKFHNISSGDLAGVKRAVDNFDELLITFKDRGS